MFKIGPGCVGLANGKSDVLIMLVLNLNQSSCLCLLNARQQDMFEHPCWTLKLKFESDGKKGVI